MDSDDRICRPERVQPDPLSGGFRDLIACMSGNQAPIAAAAREEAGQVPVVAEVGYGMCLARKRAGESARPIAWDMDAH